ncbi:MAG: aminopeptidase P family protein [Gemmatimonadota bacterium]|nr:MAG: aminopeptidase P family protein [Gemmatimonadota bacterium]
MIKEKITQAIDILKEKNVDAWLTFVRESDTVHDPSLDFILGTSCTWQSAFIITQEGLTAAIVGSLDVANIESRGCYGEVIGYKESIQEALHGVLQKLDPQTIALNYSTDSPLADGLTHGMYLNLMKYLRKTPYAKRIISAEPIVAALRGRKSPTEIERIQEAVQLTLVMFDRVSDYIQVGRTEKEVAAFLKEKVKEARVELAWDPDYCPSVFTGPESAGAHAGPTDRTIARGHLMNIDFGVKKDDYCSDLQRTWYVLREGEAEPPDDVRKAFDTIREAIQLAAARLKPGVEGWIVDDVARSHITSAGYDEYPHALGHQIGRFAHDGAGLLCPKWDRYGKMPHEKVEAQQVYTIEPRITLKEFGVATIEEIVVVTDSGCQFLSDPQKEIYIIKE